MAYSDFGSAETIARSKRGTTNRSLGAKAVGPTRAPSAGFGGVTQKIKDVGSQVLDVAGMVVGKTANFAKNTPGYVYKDVEPFLRGVAKTVTGDLTKDLHNNRLKQDQLDLQQNQLVSDFKSGKISKDNYALRMRDLSASYSELSKSAVDIQAQTDRGNVVESAAMTLADIVSAGKFRGKVVTKGVPQVFTNAASSVEKTFTKIPAVRALVERNAKSLVKQMAGETLEQAVKRQSKDLAIGLLIKRPVLYQLNFDGAENVYKEILDGNYGSAAKSSAWLATQMLEGGPLGAAFRLAKRGSKEVKVLAFGKGSFLDELGQRTDNDLVGELLALQKKDPKAFASANKTWRIIQETNLQMADDDVKLAVDNFLRNYSDTGINLKSLTPDEIGTRATKWLSAQEYKNDLVRKGLIPNIPKENASKVVVVRWDSVDKEGLVHSAAVLSDDVQERLTNLEDIMNAPGTQYGNNELLAQKLRNIIANEQDVGERIALIRKIEAASVALDGLPEGVAKRLGKLGYTLAVPKRPIRTPIISSVEETRKLVTAAVTHNTEIFDAATSSQAHMAAIAGVLERFGLSPRASNTVANRALSESVVEHLNDLNIGKELGLTNRLGDDMVGGGQAIIHRLQNYIENQKPNKLGKILTGGAAQASAVTDIRQLTKTELIEALGVTKSQAKLIKEAIVDAYASVPMSLRGLGDHIVDKAYQLNPFQGAYSRTQSALRYTYNPFFKTQEAVETNILSGIQGGNRFKTLKNNNFLWNKSMNQLDDMIGSLDRSGFFSSSLPGEAAQDQVLGRISANITRGQKRDLAGLALDIADSKGISVQQLIERHTDEVEDALRVVVQYGRKGVLASPLARTMNLAFFPVRYNTKVTLLAANVLAKQPPSIQLATIHSMFKMKDWLKSDEGIAWQSAHADAIQVFNWITPINSIKSVLGTLSHKPDSVSDVGMLGGLPFGVISQILDSQGLISLNKPYVNPKTGDVFPDYIPKSTQARASVAIQDLLNSMFTYPGRILGLPGKKASLQDAVRKFIATNGTDFEKRLDMEKLTPLQKNWVRVLKGDTSDDAISQLYTSPAEGQFNWYTLPPLNLPMRQPLSTAPNVARRTGLPTKASTKKKKTKNFAQPISR